MEWPSFAPCLADLARSCGLMGCREHACQHRTVAVSGTHWLREVESIPMRTASPGDVRGLAERRLTVNADLSPNSRGTERAEQDRVHPLP